MHIHLIAAVGMSGQIGLNGKLPWEDDPKYRRVMKADMSWFARLTEGQLLIMGPRTARSLPPSFDKGDREIMVYTQGDPMEFFLHMEAAYPGRDAWLCGGASIYKALGPYAEFVHITRIPYDGSADVWMPEIPGAYTPPRRPDYRGAVDAEPHERHCSEHGLYFAEEPPCPKCVPPIDKSDDSKGSVLAASRGSASNSVEVPYRCPVCRKPGEDRYMTCNRPDCTDGRDPR